MLAASCILSSWYAVTPSRNSSSKDSITLQLAKPSSELLINAPGSLLAQEEKNSRRREVGLLGTKQQSDQKLTRPCHASHQNTATDGTGDKVGQKRGGVHSDKSFGLKVSRQRSGASPKGTAQNSKNKDDRNDRRFSSRKVVERADVKVKVTAQYEAYHC